MQRSETTPDEFLATLPDERRTDMETLDRVISAAMDGEERVLWDGVFWGGTEQHIIGYGSYRYQGRSGAEGEWFKIGLAAQKNYLSVYANASDGGQSLAKAYAPRLGKVKAGSANLQFKRAADVDLEVLREMVGRARELIGTG